jgi:hypothetical protein
VLWEGQYKVSETESIDWKILFFKYVERVNKEEGVDFLGTQYEYKGLGVNAKWCTDDEWAAIQIEAANR